MDPVIETVGLTKRYGARRGIDSVTLSANKARSSASSARTAPARRRRSRLRA